VLPLPGSLPLRRAKSTGLPLDVFGVFNAKLVGVALEGMLRPPEISAKRPAVLADSHWPSSVTT